MAFAAYLQENAILMLSRDGAFTHLFRPHCERFAVFAAFPEKKIAYSRIKIICFVLISLRNFL